MMQLYGMTRENVQELVKKHNGHPLNLLVWPSAVQRAENLVMLRCNLCESVLFDLDIGEEKAQATL